MKSLKLYIFFNIPNLQIISDWRCVLYLFQHDAQNP